MVVLTCKHSAETTHYYEPTRLALKVTVIALTIRYPLCGETIGLGLDSGKPITIMMTDGGMVLH